MKHLAKRIIAHGRAILLQNLRQENMFKMKKIAILLTSIPQSGGEHQYLLLLMEALAKCDKKYFNVLAVCYNRFWSRWCRKNDIDYIENKLDFYSDNFIKICGKLPWIMQVYCTYKLSLGKIISKNKIKLLIGGQQSIFIPPYHCKIIQPVHDLMHRYEPNFTEINDSYIFRETFFSSSARITDVVLVDSELGKKQYIECYYHSKKHNPRIEVLPFATTISYKAVEEYIEVPSKFIFYPAQFWEHKNHLNLITAIKLLKKKISDIQLVLVGSERNFLSTIRKKIEEDLLEDNISIHGFVSDGQMIYLYKHAVALVMPTYFGPTNIPPLEAMALGCPVIVSDRYAMSEQTGDAGLLCNPDSPEDIARAIYLVWTDDNLRDNMIMKGYQQIKKWTSKDFKKKFIKILLHELKIHTRR